LILRKYTIVDSSASPISSVLTWVQPAVPPPCPMTALRQPDISGCPMSRWVAGMTKGQSAYGWL
jgi:hypothetical protein